MLFDKVAMLLKEKNKKLLLKQREVAEAFASARDASVSFPTGYSNNFPIDVFPQHGNC